MTRALRQELSVVIPAYNASRTLDALLAILCRPGGPSVIVVNDGSTDSTLACLKKYPVKVLNSPNNQGIAVSRNRGWRAARTPYVAFVDADCLVSNQWAADLLKEFKAWEQRDHRVAAMSGRVLPFTKRFCDQLAAYVEHWEYQGGVPEVRLKLSTSNCICSRKILEKVGGFDEQLAVDEDRELALRLAARGYKSAYHPGIDVSHHHDRQTMAAVLGHQFFWGRSIGLTNEWRYRHIRRMGFVGSIRTPWIYFFLVPAIAAILTMRIISRLLGTDPKVVVLTPWIFAAKLAYRYGVLVWLTKPHGWEKP